MSVCDRSTSKWAISGASRLKFVQDTSLIIFASTFLPQDRVASFAAMSPQELLKETQKAAGAQNLTQWHTTLIEKGATVKELKKVRLLSSRSAGRV